MSTEYREERPLELLADIWVWVVLALGAVVALAGGGFAVRALWLRATRKALVALVSRREAILAARRSLEEAVRHLADSDDEGLDAFARDPDHEDRRTLTEVASRMHIAFEELDTKALPSALVPVAEGLADAAYVVYEEAGRVGEATDPLEVFDSLAAIDLGRVASVYDQAAARVKAACERYHLDETAVYGGGLYI